MDLLKMEIRDLFNLKQTIIHRLILINLSLFWVGFFCCCCFCLFFLGGGVCWVFWGFFGGGGSNLCNLCHYLISSVIYKHNCSFNTIMFVR